MEVSKDEVLELSIDEDLSVYVNLPAVIDLDSDDTDYSGDELENPAEVDQEYVLKEEKTTQANTSTVIIYNLSFNKSKFMIQ